MLSSRMAFSLTRFTGCSLNVLKWKSLPRTLVSIARPLTSRPLEFGSAYRFNPIGIRPNLLVPQLYGVRYLHVSVVDLTIKNASPDDGDGNQPPPAASPPPKPTLMQRFKQMYKDYWYVLIPVHVVTSAVWFSSFYFSVKSGLDVIALLESIGVSEKIINPLRGSSAGYIALAYAMYKVATPARYAVTLGGTTVSINYLTRWGYIKPMPSTEQLKVMYNDKKVIYKDKYNVQREAFRKKLRQHKATIKRKMQLKKRSTKKQ